MTVTRASAPDFCRTHQLLRREEHWFLVPILLLMMLIPLGTAWWLSEPSYVRYFLGAFALGLLAMAAWLVWRLWHSEAYELVIEANTLRCGRVRQPNWQTRLRVEEIRAVREVEGRLELVTFRHRKISLGWYLATEEDAAAFVEFLRTRFAHLKISLPPSGKS